MIRESIAFLKRNWVHLAIAPVLAFTLVTFLHEAAHAVAVIVQGGTLTEFSFLPGGDKLGFVRYTFPEGAYYWDDAIALAPYLMWAALAACTTLVALVPIRWPHAIASTAFVWLFVVPLLDIAYQTQGWLRGVPNDLRKGLGPPDELWAIVALFGGMLAFAGGWVVQRLLYRDKALSVLAYVFLSVTCACCIVALFIVLEVARFAGLL